jgi:chemotaxis protein MotB
MALNRRNGQRFEANIWPGFVDAMTALLLVLVFVLSIFMIVQFMLRETISSQDNELDNLSSEVLALVDALGIERDFSRDLTDQAQILNAQIDAQTDEAARQSALVAALQQQATEQAGRIGSFEEQVAGLLNRQGELQSQIVTLGAQRDELNATVKELDDQNRLADEKVNSLTARLSDIEAGLTREISSKEAAQLALAQARSEIDVSTERARLAAAQREALEALVADLRSDVETRDTALEEANQALSETDAARLTQAAAAQVLRERLEGANAELTAMSLTLEEKRREAEETLTLLAAAGAAEDALNDRLIKVLAATRLANETAATSEASLRDQLTEQQAATIKAEEKIALLLNQLQVAQGKDATIEELRSQLDAAVSAQSNSEDELLQLRTEADAVALDLLTKLQTAKSEAALFEKSLRDELAAALAAENAARLKADGALSADEQRQALLAAAQTELAEERELSTKNQRQVEALNQQIAQLRSQLGGLQELLDASNARDVDSNVEIQSLGAQLNQALAQVASEQKRVATEQTRVAEEQRRRAELEEAERLRLEAEAKELKNYRSEFFGQLRDLLGDQDGIRIEGDRFVFSSEVLFRPGEDALSVAGRDEIAKVAAILTQIASDIPDTLDWVIRVDGHTDNVPLSGLGEFVDNWELSQARSLSVVRFMSRNLGIPPNRLAANGFGEYQPIASGDTPEARAQNRRIELKLTEK